MWMLQVFHVDVAKVDQDVAYVAMVVHIYCKLLFSIFQLFFQTYVASVFIWMLRMFHTYAISVFIWMLRIFYNGFSYVFGCFASVSDACLKCFICLRRMLQVLHLDISK